MKRRTFLTKWVLPFTLIALLLAWQLYEETTKPAPDYVVALFVSVVSLAISFFVFRAQNKEEPDEVLDGGGFLRIRFGNEVEDVRMSDLVDVETRKIVRHTRLVLHLRAAGKFGDVISFYPLQNRDSSGENAIGADLKRRLLGVRNRDRA